MGADGGPGVGPVHGPEPASRWHRYRPLARQVVRYAVVGGSSTALTAGLYLVLRNWLDAVPANLVALTLSTAASTEANRLFAFGGARAHRLREWVQDVGTVVFYAGYSSVVLIVLHLLVPGASARQEALAVAAASVVGGVARFLVLRYWVFDTRPVFRRAEARADSQPCSTTSPRST